MAESGRRYNGPYEGRHLDHVSLPMGGIGAGMICLEGTGALSGVSIRHRPEVFGEPMVFAALWVKGIPGGAKVLEGPVPTWKVFSRPGSGGGLGGKTYGLPRFAESSFQARFPFGTVRLSDASVPTRVSLTGWSPFVPGDPDSSSLPVAAIEYRFSNPGREPVEAVFSFHAQNFLPARPDDGQVQATEGGFILRQPGQEDRPWQEAALAAFVDDPQAKANCAWFRGGWFDSLTMLWREVAEGSAPHRPPVADGPPSPGGSVFVPFTLAPRERKIVRLLLAWYVPHSDVCAGLPRGQPITRDSPRYRPWYAGRFADIRQAAQFWRTHYDDLRDRTRRFTDCFYDTTLPPEVVEAVAANLAILKSPTVLRQMDGRLWAWEGCSDAEGCCHGSCTHVWNYAQALPHLLGELERSLRQTEFHEDQDDRGHQVFRAALPIAPLNDHSSFAAADGQLGGIMRVHREWRIGGDTGWLRAIWPRVKASLEYCIRTWDPDRQGLLREFHHNTYDVEFWGPDGLCCSMYVGALKAAAIMAEALGEDPREYLDLYYRARSAVEQELFNGEYFVQKVQWRGLRHDPLQVAKGAWSVSYDSPEAMTLFQQEGPKYQYGDGCLADGVLGAWIAEVCGVGEILDRRKVASHLSAVFRHNFREDLSGHVNPQRPGYALGGEAGLLMCTWPRGARPSLPFPYCDEVWTGVEYQVASHLMMTGAVQEGLRIVRAVRDRYDGRVRNPFDEYECGHWYARAMSSYALIQGLTGIRYDAVDKTLYVRPSISGDFRSFLCASGGYGTCGVRGGQPFLEVKSGTIDVQRIEYRPAG